MTTFLGVIVFVFGAIVGSFLNVVTLRYKTGRTVGGRSFCFSCGKTLRALELIPVISFVCQRGRCRSCKTGISWQYPLVELATGLVFLLIYGKTLSASATLGSMLFFWFAFSVLIVISAYDAKHKIVPDFAVFVFALASLIWLLLSHPLQYFLAREGVFDLLSGPIFFLPFYIIWKVSDGAWMGLGDGKLAIGIGWMLGLAGGVSAIILGFWSAAAAAIFLLLCQSISGGAPRLSRKTEVPFAPFLALGALLAFLFEPDLFYIKILILGQ